MRHVSWLVDHNPVTITRVERRVYMQENITNRLLERQQAGVRRYFNSVCTPTDVENAEKVLSIAAEKTERIYRVSNIQAAVTDKLIITWLSVTATLTKTVATANRIDSIVDIVNTGIPIFRWQNSCKLLTYDCGPLSLACWPPNA